MWNNEYQAVSVDSVRDFMYKVYGWMSCALAITAAVAFGISSSQSAMSYILGTPFLFIGLLILQVITVVFLAARVKVQSYFSSVLAFLFYSALSGVTFSVYFYMYTESSIYLTFAITAGMFLTMALYGHVTKSDLSSMHSYLMMGLFGVMIATIANIFFQSPAVMYYISLVAVGIFTLLTAYNVQKIKQLAMMPTTDLEGKNKRAILGALTLYLDFVNLFIHLLQLFGKRKR
ncbi:Bax inhibitor-1/YccA family protein [Candidatus Babeliales bacterium]|nr:Bax inhibitor-1/YccA family protein [Candidatus Babeliales bacterium]